MLSKKDPFLSLPASRVGLSTRLNQLGQLGSRPTTPASYVSSSLNPNRNVPNTSGNVSYGNRVLSPEALEQFEELPIVQDIRRFELTLAELATAVSSFKDNDVASSVHKLIDINTSILDAVGELETHQRLLEKITQVKTKNEEIDKAQKDKLRKLISIRASLRLVPGPSSLASSTTAKDLQGIDIQTLLDYSMKLAKFSRAPATIQSQMVHPNNYIWPAEDALRRGMLAMASLKPDELIRAEIGAEEANEVDDVDKMDVDANNSTSTEPNKQETDTEPSKQETDLDNSSGSSGSIKPVSMPPRSDIVSKPVPTAAPSLDLDLFDDDDSDESNNSD